MSACSFYSELYKLSTADFYSSNKRKRRRLEYGGNYLSVECLFAVKDRGKVIYLEITSLHMRPYKLVSRVFVVKSNHKSWIFMQEEKEYLVLWKDFSRYDATYEPEPGI